MNRLLRITYLLLGILSLSAAALAQAPVANFSGTPLNSCSPIVVQFTDLSTNTPTSWSWNLGNGTTSTQQNPSTTYSTPGSYTVTMTATNASGSSSKTLTNYITILPAPSVVFTATDSTAGCGSKVVQFNNASTFNAPGSGSYYWDFGDGTYSTLAAPNHAYATPGAYSVSLVVSNSAGCTKLLTKTNYINVLNKPVAGFTASNNASCTAPLTTTFTNGSSGATSYYWSFGDGDTSTLASPSHVYLTTGSFTVTLIAKGSGGCNDTMTKTAFVNIGLLSASFTQSATSTCTGNGVSFTNTTTPGTSGSVWYFGDGTTSTATNPTHAYAAAGTYTVKLKVNYGNCSDSVTHTVTVATGPSSSFTGTPLASCSAPLTTTFTNNTTGAVSYLWLFGDGTTSTSPNPSHTYNANGTYTVKLVSTSSNGCTDTLTKAAYVVIQPVTASITGNSVIGCAPASASFTGSGTSPVPITGYSWSFGDGGTGTGASVSHTYTTPGTYTLTLTVTAGSCTATTTSLVVVGTKPTANFSASPTTACTNSPVTFTNLSSGITSVLWLYGNGTSGTSMNTTHQIGYGTPGTYSVTLIVSNNGCTDTMVKTNYITILNPTASFTYTYACTNRKVFNFTNTSISATSYSWDFGDGSATTSATSPSHTYAANGTYNVTLTATNSVTGCVTTATLTVKVFDLTASVVASDTVICKGSSTAFTTISNSNYAAYDWDFGDGYTITYPYTINPVGHTYNNSGLYTVKLRVSDLFGCADTIVRSNYINVRSPNVAFTNTPSMGCSSLTVTFSDGSSPSSGSTITSRTWRFGDGTSLTTAATTITHTYTGAGAYTVRLVITEAGGCSDSLTKPGLITVNKPVAAFISPDTAACVKSTVQFTNTSTGVAPFTYAWTFGDGGTSTATSPSHAYLTAGSYTVRLITTDTYGCKDTMTRSSYINASPVQSAFTVNDSVAYCPPFTVNFTNNSVNGVSYIWIFGNGSISFLNSPSATYTAPGTYIAKLVAINANGCRDTSQKTILVNTGPSGTITYTPIAGCSPVVVSFTATATNTTSITYDFDNGITQTTTATNVTYTYTQPGVYHPKLILSNAGGCSTYVGGIDSIAVNKIRVGFTVNPNPACANTPVTFTDTSNAVTSAIATRNWSFGDGGTSTATNPAHTYTVGGTYTVRLIAATAGGCVDTAYKTVTINPAPLVVGTSPIICAGQSTSLSVSGAATYNWSPATGLSCTNCANPTATPPSTTTYTITGTSALGCLGTGTLTVTVNPLPSLTVSGPQSICGGGSVTLNATGATSYSWNPGTGLSCTSCASTSASPSATTTYTVTGTNTTTLCASTATVTVTVTNNPTVTVAASPGTTICAGSSTVIAATGATTYSWSPAAGLSCTTCSNPIATPSATTTYTVTGTASGCSTAVATVITVTPLPVVAISGPSAICAGTTATLTASGATSYSWSPAASLTCNNCASPTAAPTGTTTYTVTGTTAGCNGTATKTLTVNPLPTVNAGADVAVCAGASTTLTATGATSYSWSPSAGLSCTGCASPTATPTATTSYVVAGTDGNGCSKTDTVVVTVNPLPVVSGGANVSICPGGSTTLTGTGAATYVWSPGATLSCTACATTTATPVANTTYKVVGTSALGCKDSATVTVSINANPTVAVSGANAICAGSSTTLTASGGTTYSWTPATGLSCTSCASPTANPAVNTTYTVTGSSGAGCSATTTFTVTVNPLPVVNAGVDTAFCAGGSVTLNATGAATYAWSPATGLSATTGASTVASPTATTTYLVTGTTAAGCAMTDTVVVTVKPLPTISAGTSVSICPGGTATLTATGGVSYSWSPSTGLSATTGATVSASPTSNTTYIVTGTAANGCSMNSSVQVSINPNPSVSVSGNNAICAGANTTLTATGASSYTWSPATGLSATTGSSVTANPTATTTYTITGTSGVGCTATTTFTLTVNQLPTVSGGANKSICAGASTTLNATGASTYSWSPATGLSSTTSATPTANPSATTIYTVTGTSSAGCVGTANVTVTVNPLPTVSAGANVSICPGGNTTLTASGAATYVWSPAVGLSATTGTSVTASPVSTTVYTVTGTSAAGCTNTATVTVSVNGTPSVGIAGTGAICAGGSTTLTASGASSYTWSPATGLSSTTGATVTANPATSTTYTVTGTSGVGCTGTATFTVTVNQLPVVNAGVDTAFCAGGSVTLNATGAAIYTWIPAAGLSATTGASVSASPTATTTYVVTGTSMAGCSANDTVVVTVRPLPIISAGANAGICPGGSVTLTPSGGTGYVWSTASSLSCTACTSPVATPSATTTYTVTGTGANGCSATANVTVTVNPLPVISITGKTDVCAGSNTVLTASGAATYTWSPAAGLSCTACASPTVTPAATTTYKVIGTSGLGCKDSTTITVNLRPLPVVSVDTPQTACLNAPVQLNASGALTYIWTPAAGLSCATCASPVATPATTTTYIVTGTDGYGCIDTAQTTITVLPLPIVNAGPDVSICKGNSTTLNATGATSYVWTPATGLSCTTCASPTASPAATTTYVVTGSVASGCQNSDTVVVSLYAQPPVNAGPDQTICAGSVAQLQASGAQTYAWTPGATLTCTTCANPKATPMANTTYMVVGTDVHGCVDSDQVAVTVIPHNPVYIGPGGEVCAGGLVQLSAGGGDSYAWSPGVGLSCTNCANPTANPPATTTYRVVIRQGQCFTDTLSAEVIIHPIPTVNAGPDQSIILGNIAQINATGTNIQTYSWSPTDGLSCVDCPDPKASPAVDITYVVTVTSDFGCTAQDDITIHVRCDGSQIWLPNTFTPNADGQNDRFYPHGKGIDHVDRFRIYDRWGELLYDRTNMPVNDKTYGWDGTYKSQPLKPDVYVWIMDGTCTNGEKLQTKGDISLIR